MGGVTEVLKGRNAGMGSRAADGPEVGRGERPPGRAHPSLAKRLLRSALPLSGRVGALGCSPANAGVDGGVRHATSRRFGALLPPPYRHGDGNLNRNKMATVALANSRFQVQTCRPGPRGTSQTSGSAHRISGSPVASRVPASTPGLSGRASMLRRSLWSALFPGQNGHVRDWQPGITLDLAGARGRLCVRLLLL
jgi:hypothetical protein